MTRIALSSLTAVLLFACSGGPEPTSDETTEQACIPSDEVCDGVDNDCDGDVDEGLDQTFFADIDGDGFGDADAAVVACAAPDDHVAIDGDCDDALASVSPEAPEQCDGIDNDCDDVVDEDFIVFDDLDGDGFGDPASEAVDCAPTPDLVAIGGDCDDTRNDVNPDALEICDGLDNDCDPLTSEASTAAFVADDGSVDPGFGAVLAGTADEPALVALDAPGTLHICEGTWFTRFDVQAKGVHLRGVSGSERTILDAAGAGRIVSIFTANSSFSMKGLTLQNGDATADTSCVAGAGGAMCVRNTASHFTYEDLVLVGNRAQIGGAMFAAIGTHTLTNVVISDNASENRGGGLATDRAQIVLQDTELTRNVSGGSGGGMSVLNGFLDLDGVDVIDNSAAVGGGILANTRLTARNTRILDNEASERGGALRLGGGADSLFEDTVVQGNVAPVAGAIELALAADATMTCRGTVGVSAGIFDNETTSPDGGAVTIASGTFLAEDCDFADAGARNAPHDFRFDSDGSTLDLADADDATLICTVDGCEAVL